MHGIYLEDLYLRPVARGAGLGRALLAALAEECVRRGYTRLQWWVLDWNDPAIGFYKALGAEPMDEWSVMRVNGAALDRLAGTSADVGGGLDVFPGPGSGRPSGSGRTGGQLGR